MQVIDVLVIGESGIGKSTLVETYMWKLHFGYAYHDHLLDHRRYHIQLVKISQIEELQNVANQRKTSESKIIYLFCFKVSAGRPLGIEHNKWLIEIRKIDPVAKVFLLGLHCDVEKGFLARVWNSFVPHSKDLNSCRHSEHLQYLECCPMNVKHVEGVFDTILRLVLYGEGDATKNSYNSVQIKYEFNVRGEKCTFSGCN